MWRLIVVTFGFLGWAFYVLSGGADYAPSEGSRQHAAAHETSLPAAQPSPSAAESRHIATPSEQPSGIVLASASAPIQVTPQRLDAPVSDAEKRLRLTLETVRSGGTAPQTGVTTVAADPKKIARLIAAANAVRPQADPTPEPAAGTASTDENRDLRKVKGSRVNMRQGPGKGYSVVSKLDRGTRVEVLRDEGDGWVKLRVVETGRIGWMADFLLAAAN